MFALYLLIMLGNAQAGWTHTVTYVGDYRDKDTCLAAAKNSVLEPSTTLPGSQPPTFICIPKSAHPGSRS
jgi:hypothetical protein